MAEVIGWNKLDFHMGETLYEEWHVMPGALNKVVPVEILDITHMKFRRWREGGKEYATIQKYTPDIRYWDSVPTNEEMKERNWK